MILSEIRSLGAGLKLNNFDFLRFIFAATIAAINRKLLWHFLPFHLLLLRATDTLEIRVIEVYAELYGRYHREPLFWVCCMPVLKFPTSIARLWGYGLIILGRLVNGEFGRLWVAIREKLSRKTTV